MTEDAPEPDIRPMTPGEQAWWNRVRLESASRERLVADITGEGEPPIVVRMYHGEAMSLAQLLIALRDLFGHRPAEVDHLLGVIGRQISGQWENPAPDFGGTGGDDGA